MVRVAFFKVPAKKTPEGNYQTEATCDGPQHHTVYKKTGDTSEYTCPHTGCGHTVH